MLDIMRRNAQSWVVKIIFGIIILVFVFWGVGTFGATNPELLLRINGEPVTLEDFKAEYSRQVNMAKSQMPNLPDEIFKSEEHLQRVLAAVIDKKLLLQEADRLGLGVGVGEVQNAIVGMSAFQNEKGQFSLEIYKAVLDNERISRAAFEKDLMSGMLLEKLGKYMAAPAYITEDEAFENYSFIAEERKADYLLFPAADYVEGLELSDNQINDYYEKNKQMFMVPAKIDVQYLLLTPQVLASRYAVSEDNIAAYYKQNPQQFTEEPKTRLSQILLAVPQGASKEAVAKVEAKANALYKEAQAGKNFAQLARENSDDPSAASGGSMGWIAEGELSPVLANTIDPLKAGEVGKPFASSLGFHIIKLDEREDSRLKKLPEVKEQIKVLLASGKAMEELPGILDKAVADVLNGKSLEEIARELSLAVTNAEALQRDVAGKELGLSAEAVETLFHTPEGITVDRPLPSGQGYLLAKVLKSDPEHVAPLEDVKDRIIALLKVDESRTAALRAAENGLKELDEGKTLASPKIMASSFFSRQGSVAELGPAPDVVAAVFGTADKKKWLGPYLVGRGAVLVKLDTVRSPDAKQWAEIKEVAMLRLGSVKQEAVFSAYLADLKNNAKLEDYGTANLGRFIGNKQ